MATIFEAQESPRTGLDLAKSRELLEKHRIVQALSAAKPKGRSRKDDRGKVPLVAYAERPTVVPRLNFQRLNKDIEDGPSSNRYKNDGAAEQHSTAKYGKKFISVPSTKRGRVGGS